MPDRDDARAGRRQLVFSVLGASALALSFVVPPALRTKHILSSSPEYLGSERCGACHPDAFTSWKGSHHAAAMQPARGGTVLGDFSDQTMEHEGKRWRFRRDREKYVVTAEGPDGAMRDYEVAYTFGVDPLQQYLVPFPDGRLQCLPAAWDVQSRRWFFVSRGPAPPPGDWLHWTRPGQTWNTMCADCHATSVKKGYDPAAGSFRTTWSELGVGCEGCHGPGSQHVAWADQPAAARPAIPDFGLATRTSAISNQDEVSLCAPCHSRRAQLADAGRPGTELLDRYLPSLLSPGVFHADGQIQDEDFEYQAFTQSRMFAKGVRCSDCHDVHSGKRHAEGNALCTRCHAADTYDGPHHHFHQASWRGQPGPGAQCVSCHMPGHVYMGVHFRRDHSLRVPRPYDSAATGAPDACSAAACHADKPASWILEHFDRWYGKQRKPHYGSILAAGRAGSPEAQAGLVRLALDASRPAFARATALDLLGGYGGDASVNALERALLDPDPLLRHTAVARLDTAPARLARLLAPLLGDPIRAVRAEAAARLAGDPAALLAPPQQKAQAAALEEYVASQLYLSDTPSGPFNLGNLYTNLGRADEAERQYRRALEIDGKLHAARVNLALLLARVGQAAEAERLLREVHAAEPRQADVALDLGLLLVEQGKHADAEQALRAALSANPALAPAAYNLAVLVGERSPSEAVALAQKAAALAPAEARYAWTLGFFQARAGDRTAAVQTLEALLERHPDHQEARELLGRLKSR